MLHILYGEDASRIDYKTETIRQKLQPDEYTRLDAKKDDSAAVFMALDSMSLFSEKPMVVIENASFLGAKNETGIDPKDIAARDLSDKTVVLQYGGRKLDTRKKAVKQLAAHASVLECKPLDDKSQPAEIRALLKERGLEMDRQAFDWFCLHVGYSMPVIASTLDKMALYDHHLSLADVRALTTVEPTRNVFAMLDALYENDRIRLLGLYRDFRAQNMEPQQILALLAGQIRFVFDVRVMMDEGKSQQEMMEALQASSGRIWNSMKNARRFSAPMLMEKLALLSRLDQHIKSGQIDRDLGFENFILQLDAPGQRR